MSEQESDKTLDTAKVIKGLRISKSYRRKNWPLNARIYPGMYLKSVLFSDGVNEVKKYTLTTEDLFAKDWEEVQVKTYNN